MTSQLPMMAHGGCSVNSGSYRMPYRVIAENSRNDFLEDSRQSDIFDAEKLHGWRGRHGCDRRYQKVYGGPRTLYP